MKKSELGIKSRVFIDLLNQIPKGSAKMTCKCNVFSEIADERKAENEELKIAVDRMDRFFICCNIDKEADKDIEEARKWLVLNGYVREWQQEGKKGTVHFFGITEKGWLVADKYLRLAAQIEA